MDNILQISTTFTCQYYLNKKKIIIRSSSEHIKDFLSVIGAEYSKILDGYLLDTDKTFIDIIGMHSHVIKCIENLYSLYDSELKEESDKENIEKKKKKGEISVKKKVEMNADSSSFETTDDSNSVENMTTSGYILNISNDEWIIYFNNELLNSEIFSNIKIKYNKTFMGFSFKNENKYVGVLEKNGYIIVNGVFHTNEKSCHVHLSNHLKDDEKNKEISEIKKLSGRFNKKLNLFSVPIKFTDNLLELGYINVSN